MGAIAARVVCWAARSQQAAASSVVQLAPLTPEFNSDQHQTYVDYLNSAIENTKIRNIALTGRYGSGKSSVLAQFAQQELTKKRVLFLALSTLGPDLGVESSAGQPTKIESRTNRIQKELVKQLLHREKPSRLPQSRYQRIEVLPRWRVVLEAVATWCAGAASLWALGWFPAVPGVSSEYPWPLRVVAGAAVAFTVPLLLAWGRIAIHDRFSIAELSAAGATISLTRTGSYFDEYLDEIVYFFESARHIDLVVFEDLDRFDDPGIFEALRELNTLLNSSKQMGTRTIRFVYALRDSVFELLGADGVGIPSEADRSEATRANRTKFFDLVIPIVPFITHRNARDLLTQVLSDRQLGELIPVSQELVDLTARHLPDMRLLTNIRNEYSAFAQRLIVERRGVESLSPDSLFALIAYKNVHLADFEELLLGRSKLDQLYRISRQVVGDSIDARRSSLRRLENASSLQKALDQKAATLGARLLWFIDELRKKLRGNHTLESLTAGGIAFSPTQVTESVFWSALTDSGTSVSVRFSREGIPDPLLHEITTNDLRQLLGQDLPTSSWGSTEHAAIAGQRTALLNDLEVLRTADFKDLVKRDDFTALIDDESVTFGDALRTIFESELVLSLVSEGYIDRYYTLAIAQYYGDHVPANAMNFIVQNVDANRADVNYAFDADGEIAAVLRETRRSFLSDRSAYNTAILDYLLVNEPPNADVVLGSVVAHFGPEERAFLDAYFTDGAKASTAASQLAGRWPHVFAHLAVEADLTEDARRELVNSAISGSRPEMRYEFDDAVRSYLQGNYGDLAVLAKDSEPDAGWPTNEQVSNAVDVLARAGVVCGDLSVLSPAAVRLVVGSNCYTITARNLRVALSDPATLSLDRVAGLNPDVYEDCLQRLDDYLEAVSGDLRSETATISQLGVPVLIDPEQPPSEVRTPWTIETPEEFLGIVNDVARVSIRSLVAVLSRAHPDCIVEELVDVSEEAWQALAQTGRVRVTWANVDAYVQQVGEIDASLAASIIGAGHISAPSHQSEPGDDLAVEAERETKSRVAAAILNSSGVIPDPADRVSLCSSLALGDWFSLSGVNPEPGRLLGHLVAAGIWSDEGALFAHFAAPDWETLRFAIQQSARFAEYMTPQLLSSSMAIELLRCDEIALGVRQEMLKRFAEFIDLADKASLLEVGKAAIETGTLLGVEDLSIIAAGTGDPTLIVQLLAAYGKGISPDELLAVLTRLPAPYSELLNSGARLTTQRDSHYEAVFKRLQSAGRVEARLRKASIRKPSRIEVTVK